MGEFITCGTMFRTDNSQGTGQIRKKGANPISKERNQTAGSERRGPMTDLEK